MAVAIKTGAEAASAHHRWFMVAPYGRMANRTAVQMFDAGTAEQLVTAFENAKEQAGGDWRGVPIYVGFPLLDPQTYKDGAKYGSVLALDARPDGLYALSKWSKAGRTLLDNEAYDYVNPVCESMPMPGQPGVVRPVRLVSVGLTNTAVPGALPLSVMAANDAGAISGNPKSKVHPFDESIQGPGQPYRAMFFGAVNKTMADDKLSFNEAWTRCQTTHPSFWQCYQQECEARKLARLAGSQPS